MHVLLVLLDFSFIIYALFVLLFDLEVQGMFNMGWIEGLQRSMVHQFLKTLRLNYLWYLLVEVDALHELAEEVVLGVHP